MTRRAATLLLLGALAAGATPAQVVTPRGRVAAVYKEASLESNIVAEVEPNGRWRLDFSGAEIPAHLSEELSTAVLRYLLPGRDTGVMLLARVKGPGKNNDGWVDPQKVEISPDPAWKIPQDTLLYVPMKARQVPPVKVVAPLPVGPQSKPCSYLLLVDPEGKVIRLRLIDGSAEPPLEAALEQLRFAPVRVEGEPVHLLLAIRIEPHAGASTKATPVRER